MLPLPATHHHSLTLPLSCFQMLWCVDLRGRLDAAASSAAAVAAFDHAPELESLSLALSTGELLLVHTEGGQGGSGASPAGPEVEEVGTVEGGLAGGAWSPDGEVLALVTGTALLLLMNKVGVGCHLCHPLM